MEQYCENCGSEQTWNEDAARGELSCSVCGLVEPYQSDANAADNAGTVGEERFRERVDRDRGQAPGTIPWATRTDCNNRPISREMYNRMRGWETRERGFQRPTEPMYYQLRSRMEELYGRYITDLMTFLIRATTRRLTSEQEAYRRGLTTSEKEALNLPKHIIARSGASVRGGGEQDMLTLMAIAIRELAYDYGLAAPINRNAEAAQHGLTNAQVRKVKIIISKQYKARCRHGFSHPPSSPTDVEAKRQDMAICHTHNMLDELSSFFTEAQLEEVNRRYWDALTEIGEPSVDGFTQGRDISLVCGTVMFATLQRLDLHQGKRSAIARGVGHRSSIAIVNLLEHLRASTKKGVFPSGRVLLRGEKGPFGSGAEDSGLY
ncbi:MAG: TFIIB-type zinc ribbon-containing protein [Candidatus Poseidoniales archaeon]|jgi:hypothetical protein